MKSSTWAYPIFFQTIVGLDPSRMKTLTDGDVHTLVEAFRLMTGVDPLQTEDPLVDVLAKALEGR